MMMKKTLFLVVAAMAAGMVACTHSGKAAAEDSLVMDSIGVEHADTIANVSFHVAYPTAGTAVLVDSLRHFIVRTLQSGSIFEPGTEAAPIDLQADSEALLSDGRSLVDVIATWEYGRLKADRDEMMRGFEHADASLSYMAYESMYDIAVLHETDAYVTLSVERYEFLGGAHGATWVSGHTFSKVDGRLLGWALLRDTDSPAFRQLLREGVCSYFQKALDEPLSDEQLASLLSESNADVLPLPATAPHLVADGVAFVYQQYEIAPYAAGLPSFTVGYDAIRPYLSPVALSLLPELGE